MYFIVDQRIPREAIECLSHYGDVIPFLSQGITHEPIAGHPDIFMCPVANNVIVATNIPRSVSLAFENVGIQCVDGEIAIDETYPQSASYNAVVTDKYIIHKESITDMGLKKMTASLISIDVPQGYTRCNTIPLVDNRFVTSDKGIENVLIKNGLEVFYVSSGEITLPGHDYGFIGGTCGVIGQRIFFIGSLNYYSEGEKLRAYLLSLDYEIIELYDGPLVDGGSIFIITS